MEANPKKSLCPLFLITQIVSVLLSRHGVRGTYVGLTVWDQLASYIVRLKEHHGYQRLHQVGLQLANSISS
jgi:hypothetical protein